MPRFYTFAIYDETGQLITWQPAHSKTEALKLVSARPGWTAKAVSR